MMVMEDESALKELQELGVFSTPVTVVGRLRRFGFVQIDSKWYRKADD